MTLTGWCETNRFELKYIQSDRPQQNDFVECFNGSFLRVFQNHHLFENLGQVEDLA
jgi:putative transposase